MSDYKQGSKFDDCALDESTKNNILKHSSKAKAIRQECISMMSPEAQTQFKKYFHLRPGASGITLYSTQRHWPMRGQSQESVKKIRERLLELVSQLEHSRDACSIDFGGIIGRLDMQYHDKSDEDALQAAMISEMIDTENDKYSGIQFIASEVILGRSHPRFDILGYHPRDELLYVFELKAAQINSAECQVSEYRKYLSRPETMEMLCDMLRSYPADCNLPDRSFSHDDVRWVIVEPRDNRRGATEPEGKESDGIQFWYYSDQGGDLTFFK
jgi:hypothetical protein